MTDARICVLEIVLVLVLESERRITSARTSTSTNQSLCLFYPKSQGPEIVFILICGRRDRKDRASQPRTILIGRKHAPLRTWALGSLVDRRAHPTRSGARLASIETDAADRAEMLQQPQLAPEVTCDFNFRIIRRRIGRSTPAPGYSKQLKRSVP